MRSAAPTAAASTSTPSAAARPSPSRSTLSAGIVAAPSNAPRIASGAAAPKSVQPRPASEPASHARIASLAVPRASRSIASATIEESSADSETPASTNRSASSRGPRRASTATSTAVASPDAKPSGGTSTGATPTVAAIAIDAPAPLATPVRYGSTIGLRNNACSSVPASASDAPTVAAMTTRGTRSCHTMIAASPPEFGCSSACARTFGASAAPPNAMPISIASGTSAASRAEPHRVESSTRNERPGIGKPPTSS